MSAPVRPRTDSRRGRPGLSTPGKSNAQAGHEHMTALKKHTRVGTRALISTTHQVLSHTRYVAQFQHTSYFRLMSLPLKI
jgi:hypothetical protein